MAGKSGKGVRIGIQKPLRTGVQIRIRSQVSNALRDGLDQLEVTSSRQPAPGRQSRTPEMQEDDSNDPFAREDEAGLESPAPPETNNARQAQLIGARQPAILIRLSWDGRAVRAQPLIGLRPGKKAAALQVLCSFVEQCFARGLDKLSEKEQDELLGSKGGGAMSRRLVLLSRLAIEASAKVTLELDGGGQVTRRMSDLGLERFAYKFAALPDGTPFSLRLLLQDQRGRHRAEEDSPSADVHPLDVLPLSIKLLALRRALAAEREIGRAHTDGDFCAVYQKAVEQTIGAPIDMPDEEAHVTHFREYLERRGLHIFPNRTEREKQYRAAVGAKA
jgi:hypothetical protein